METIGEEELLVLSILAEAAKKRKAKPRLGSGERFAELTKELAAKGKRKGKGKKVRDPEALAAWIGRAKYGKAKFQKLAKRGK